MEDCLSWWYIIILVNLLGGELKMKYKVTIGTVRHDSVTVKKGNFIELTEKYAKPLLASGVIEDIAKEVEKKPVKVIKTKVDKVKPEVKAEVEAVDVEPSADWTRAELDEHALSVGVKNPEKAGSKTKLMKLILKTKK